MQRRRGTEACDISGRAGRIVFEVGRDLPRMRLDAVAGALQERLFQVAIAQPSDRGNRDRDQRNHRDGKPGCERHVGRRSPSRSGPCKPPDESDAMAHYREDATPSAGRGESRPAAARQPVTAARRSAGRNGFCRLDDRSELGRHGQKVRGGVRLRRDRPAGNDDDRNLRPVLANHPHGFEPIHSRHEDVEEQQIEISGLAQCQALSPVTGSDHVWPARSSNRRTVSWTATSSSTTSILAKVKSSPGPLNQVNGRLRVLPNPRVVATASPAGTLRSAVKKPG